MLVTSDVGTPSWRSRTLGHLRDSSVYVPLVSRAWLDDEVCQLELYYALRGWFTKGYPVVLPALFPDVPLTPGSHKLIDTLRAACFHIPFSTPEEVSAKIRNFCGQILGVESKATNGPSLRDVYTSALTALGGKKPNTGLMKLLEEYQSSPGPTKADLATNYIGDLGVQAFFTTIVPRWSMLTEIDVAANGLMNASIRRVCDALLYHPCVTMLDISRNIEITQAGCAELLLLSRRNQVLRTIPVDGTSIPHVWKKKLETQLEINRASALHSGLEGGCGVLAEGPTSSDEVVQWTFHISENGIRGALGTPSVNNTFSFKDDGHIETLAKLWLKGLDVHTIVLHGLNGKKMMYVLETEGCTLAPFLQSAATQALATMPQMTHSVSGKATRYNLKMVWTESNGSHVFVEAQCSYGAGPGKIIKRSLTRVLRESSMHRHNGNLQQELCELLTRAYEHEMSGREEIVAEIAVAEAKEREHTEGTQTVVVKNVLSQWKKEPST